MSQLGTTSHSIHSLIRIYIRIKTEMKIKDENEKKTT